MRRMSFAEPAFFRLLLVAFSWACSSSSGPDELSGLLRVSAADLDRAASAVAPAGFDVGDVTSYRIQINAGPRVVLKNEFAKTGAILHEFSLVPNTYVVLVEAFQGDDVLLLAGVGEATVTAGDTATVAVDLDPALGAVELTIGGGEAAVVPTNGTAPVRVLVRNRDGKPVAGASVDLTLDPASAGTIAAEGPFETGGDGVFRATFTSARQESQGQLRLSIDGFPVDFFPPRRFSVVSPVDANRSTLTLSNAVRLPADGISAAEILVRVVDATGTPQAGIPVVVRSGRNGQGPDAQLDEIRSDQTETDAAGEFRATLTTTSSSTLAGDAVITAEADGKDLAAQGTVTFRSVVSGSSTVVSAHPTVVPANGIASSEIEVRVVSVTQHSLADIFVRLQTRDDTLFEIRPISGRTDGNGIFRSRISSRVRTNTFIDVYADGLRTSATTFVIFR